jgi:hypothetical protein
LDNNHGVNGTAEGKAIELLRQERMRERERKKKKARLSYSSIFKTPRLSEFAKNFNL